VDSTDVAERWANRSGEYSPAYYAYYGPDGTSESIRDLLDSLDGVGRDSAILELGCSSGRHLSHLRDGGYENLYGVEINDEAFDVMEDAYPDLYARGTFYADAIENVVPGFEDGRFDVVYSVETLQHVPPESEWVFEELVRIADEVLVTVENEGASGEEGTDDSGGRAGEDDERAVNYVDDDIPLYYRDWSRIFTGLGLAQVDSERQKRDTLRVFRTRQR
jgi:SAM-dependent methyltransferase